MEELRIIADVASELADMARAADRPFLAYLAEMLAQEARNESTGQILHRADPLRPQSIADLFDLRAGSLKHGNC